MQCATDTDYDATTLLCNVRYRESVCCYHAGMQCAVLRERMVLPGDLCVATIHGVMGRRYVLASFHGDGNGFSTMPVIKALHRLMNEDLPDHFLVVGLDANTTSSTSNPVSTVAAFQGATVVWTAVWTRRRWSRWASLPAGIASPLLAL
eukprot:3863640-Rhodomonas_salina.1